MEHLQDSRAEKQEPASANAAQTPRANTPSALPAPEAPPADELNPSAAAAAEVFAHFAEAPRAQAPAVQKQAAAEGAGATGARGAPHPFALAAQGTAGGGAALPHLEAIQRSFGTQHDLSGVRAHLGGVAEKSSRELGAMAYAFGEQIAFRTAPDLRLAAHEAAHVVQQRAGQVPSGGVGQVGDAYEQQADEVAERVVAGQSAAELLPARSGASGSAAVQLKQDPAGNILPDDVNVKWGGDPFQVSFDRPSDGDDRLQFTVRYTGPHPVDGPFVKNKSKQLHAYIGSAKLNAKVTQQDALGLAVDLYGDGSRVVKLIDRCEFDDRPGKGRAHNFSVKVLGETQFTGTMWVQDPAAKPAPKTPADAAKQGDVPGENPTSTLVFDKEGTATQIRIDGDGDQGKELLLTLRAKDHWPAEMQKDVVKTLLVTATQLSSGQQQQAQFTLPKPEFGGSLFPIVQEVTDGKGPTRISLVLPIDKQFLLIHPPAGGATPRTYRAEVAGQSVPLAFSAQAETPHKIADADAPITIGGITSLDLTLGAYQDRFRLTVQPTSNGKALLGLSALQAEQLMGGHSAELALPGALKLATLKTDGISVALDLDGDGKADLQLFDRMDSPASYDGGGNPERTRNHQVRLVGAAIGGEKLFSFTVRYGSLSGGYANPSEADQQADSNAKAVAGLAAQTGSFQNDIDRYEGALHAVRKQARDKGLIQPKTYDAWAALSIDMIKLQAQRQVTPDAGLKASAGKHAADFYLALSEETRSATRTLASHVALVSSNPYTGMSSLNGTVRGPGVELQTALASGQLAAAFTSYHQLVAGLDQWIADALEKRPELAKEAQQAQFLGTMKRELGAIESKSPTRLQAVFHPDEQYKKEGRIFEVPLALYYWREGDTWHLKDLTNPQNTFEDKLDAAGAQKEPPVALFEKLDYRVHFPKGRIHYQIPGGTGGQIQTHGKRSWHEYLTYIGLGIAAVGITLATFGTGTVAVVGTYILAGSSVVGAVAAGGDLVERHQHGNLDSTTAIIDIAQIVSGLAGASALASGRIVLSASAAATKGSPWLAQWARLAVFADRIYLPATLTRIGADALTLVTITAEVAKQLDEIEKLPGDPTDKARAKALILSQYLTTATMTALVIKGELPALGRGRQLVLQLPEEGGPPRALLQGMEAPLGLKFSQKDVAPKTGDGKLTVEELTESMRSGGWKGDPIEIVEMPDGTKVSLDNRRLLAAQNAGLKEIPVLYHSPAEPIPATVAAERFTLKNTIRQLPDGTLVVGGNKGTVLFAKGAVPKNYGEAALFRTANQGNLKSGAGKFPLYGRYEQPLIRQPQPTEGGGGD